MKNKRCTSTLLIVNFFIMGILSLTGCTKILGEAQIFLYKDGEKAVLDSESPHYRKLQLACEELLTSAESL